jgi:hypothetical protein
MIFGDILSKAGKINLETADDKRITINKNIVERLAFKLFGIPHIGMRMRAYYRSVRLKNSNYH